MRQPTPTLLLPITGRRNGRNGVVVAHAVVTDDAFARDHLVPFRWALTSEGYAHRKARTHESPPRHVKLHVVVFRHYHGKLPEGCVIDHRDRDKLNNTPENLRAVCRSINNVNQGIRRDNRYGFKGVRLHPSGRPSPWQARITVAGRTMSLGYYRSAVEAAAAVNRAYQTHYPDVEPPNLLG